MIVTCSHCGKKLNVQATLQGRKVRCPNPQCRQEVEIPAAADATPPPESPFLHLADADPPPLPAVSPIPSPLHSRRRLAVVGISIAAVVAIGLVLLVPFVFRAREAPHATPAGPEVATADLSSEPLTRMEEGPLELPPLIRPNFTADDPGESLAVPAPMQVANLDSLELQLVPGGSASEGGFMDAAKGGMTSSITFMGITGRGQRFCIIADRSGSMSGAKMEFVKAEILKTLGQLKGGSKFFVVFFDSQADPMPGGRWLDGRREVVAQVTPWIAGIFGRGGTMPTPGFQVAFQLNPRPDVIFFMTDGIFSQTVPAEVAQLNQGGPKQKPVVIHTIAFMERGGELLLKQIATQSGGTYRYVPGIGP